MKSLTERILAARPHILAALEHDGMYNEEDVINRIREGRAHLWNGEKSAVVTLIEQYPRSRVLVIWLAGGDLGELTDEILPKIEAWALATGCQKVTIWGRKGWARVLRDRGYDAPITVLRKAFDHVEQGTQDRDDHAVGHV